MNPVDIEPQNDDLRPEYDLKVLLQQAKSNPFAKRYAEATNLVLLAPDVTEAFRDADAVNEVLRLVMKLARLPDSQRREK